MKSNNSSLVIGRNHVWGFFFLVKLFYMWFSYYVLSNYLVLGDMDRYLSGLTFGKSNPFASSTYMMDNFTYPFSYILGKFLANIPFVLMSFYGVYFSVSRLFISTRGLVVVLVILSFPSFGIWTSIASKEAVTVFFMGVLLGCLIDYYRGRLINYKLLLLISIYLCILFKPQYMSGLLSLFVFLWLKRNFSLSGNGQLVVVLFFILFSFLGLFVFRHHIDAISFEIPLHFRSDEMNSTRENIYWTNQFDVFRIAPYGMYIAFVGPTLDEAAGKFLQMLVLMESYILIIFISFLMAHSIYSDILRGRFNIFAVTFLLVPMLWILFVHYPFGLFNPGSAIRYRSGFYAYLVVSVFFVMTECYLRFRFVGNSGLKQLVRR
ncbi:hypothetical protein LWH48_17050 [Halomonas sp. G15]|uniref:hypothetical protein n=1 Tax=Halomonas sp. G15 TaxID=2903521 RepID=UPI001E4C6D83|nr:hypothetical protein [Halomonas sp. G15]MCE0734471.1 hypothetical protein [Halomonas sp. G15]